MLEKIKFILGSMDPEMELIKTVLDTVGANYELAIDTNGALVNPTNAYECVNTVGEAEKICFVECRNPQIIEFISIDHHNKGDYGYLLGAKDFLEASSIGQLIKFLAKNFELEFDKLNFVGFYSKKQKNKKTIICFKTINGYYLLIIEHILFLRNLLLLLQLTIVQQKLIKGIVLE